MGKTDLLEYLFCKNPLEVVFLCGAGISMDPPSSLPTVHAFIKNISEECCLSKNTREKLLAQFWNTNYRFECLIDEIRKHLDSKLLVAKLLESPTYNRNHFFLAKMLEKGASVITTNFDNCIEHAVADSSMNYDLKNRLVYNGADINLSNLTFPNNKLVKIHGSHPLNEEEEGELVITISALAKTTNAFSMLPNFKDFLFQLLCNKTLVVLGYSGSDDFDVVPLLREAQIREIIWIGYNPNFVFPLKCECNDNEKIKSLSLIKHLYYYEGQLHAFEQKWLDHFGDLAGTGSIGASLSFKEYIDRVCPTKDKKKILLNDLLLSYGLYDEVFDGTNNIVHLQKAKALFRLKKYNATVQICESILVQTNKDHFAYSEALYYLSSAYYQLGVLDKAMLYSMKCALTGIEKGDYVLYLNSLVNYAGIVYFYGFTKDEDTKLNCIKNARRKYLTVIKRAKGICIEAEANALWGLGDIAYNLGNNNTALKYLQEAEQTLINIGNVFALNQIQKTISEIQGLTK